MKRQIIVMLVTGWILAFAGLSCLVFPALDARLFFWAAAVLFSISALALLFHLLKRFNLFTLAELVLVGAMALFLWMHPLLETRLLQVVFFGYMAIMAFFLLVQVVLDVREHAWKAVLSDSLLMLLYGGLGTVCLVYAHTDLKILMYVFGFYLVLEGVQLVLEVVDDWHPVTWHTFLLREWISLPVWFVSFLPGIADSFMYKKIGKDFDGVKNDSPVNFHVYIHGGLKSEALIGHMTFSYNNIMYSYGDYDRAAESWFHTIGPGVLFTVNPEIYCNNSCIYENTDIFEFGLHLDEDQAARLEAALVARLALTYPWQCPLEQQPDPARVFAAYESVYSNRLWYRTHCKFRKFHDSPWKTYFILGMNCSLFAEDILSSIGCDIPHKRGLVSPGEYLDWFDTAFADPQSCVISRTWHSASDPATLFDVKQYG